uniref:Musculoskeletal embryonic nuclear protein 1 n=1 Tax=Acanthochromis polyacanthus TaxID=80966 RepID=A0A3Q1GGG8_9TELE
MSRKGREWHSFTGDEPMQRPEVREEDVTETRNRLGFTGPAKSKTFEVMEECEKMGKTAPSVFSRARSGAETVLSKRSTPK